MSITLPSVRPVVSPVKRPATTTPPQATPAAPSLRVVSLAKPDVAAASPKPPLLERLLKGYWWKCALADVTIAGATIAAFTCLPSAALFGATGNIIGFAVVALFAVVNLPAFMLLLGSISAPKITRQGRPFTK